MFIKLEMMMAYEKSRVKNKKSHISVFTWLMTIKFASSMDTKLDRVVAYDMGHGTNTQKVTSLLLKGSFHS